MSKFFSKFATRVASLSGKPGTFVLAVAVVLAWAISGPFFGYSETWQLVTNTGTTIIIFLMVFVLQNSQNRDGKALQAKLDELTLTSQAQNKFVGIEKLDEEALRKMSTALAGQAEQIEDVADGEGHQEPGHSNSTAYQLRALRIPPRQLADTMEQTSSTHRVVNLSFIINVIFLPERSMPKKSAPIRPPSKQTPRPFTIKNCYAGQAESCIRQQLL